MTIVNESEDDYTLIHDTTIWRRRTISGYALVRKSIGGKWLWRAVPYDKDTSEEVTGTAITFGAAKSKADQAMDNF